MPAVGATENESASTLTPAPAAVGWGVTSPQETSAAAAGWGMPSSHSTSTESVQGTSTVESTASEEAEETGPPVTEEEQPDQSCDSGHGETSFDRSHEGDQEAVKDDVDKEIAALLKDAAASPSSTESQPEDEAWLQRLMGPDVSLSKDKKTSADRDAEPVVGNDSSSASNTVDDVGSEGSGTVTPLAERSPSPISSAEAPAG